MPDDQTQQDVTPVPIDEPTVQTRIDEPPHDLSWRRVAQYGAALIGLGLIVFAVALGEYRTNIGARWVGAYLADINTRRQASGRLWKMITSTEAARKSLPDSTTAPLQMPTNLPELVRHHRLSVDRIPESGVPGYFAIQVAAVNRDQRDDIDAERLIDGSRIHQIGNAILDQAILDPSPYIRSARRRALEMSQSLDELEPEVADSTAMIPPDSIAASVAETFTAVLLEEKLGELRASLHNDWETGALQQIFLNRGLGDYQGELHYADETRTSVRFRLTIASVVEILGNPEEEASP
jgi:hypothetical protein